MPWPRHVPTDKVLACDFSDQDADRISLGTAGELGTNGLTRTTYLMVVRRTGAPSTTMTHISSEDVGNVGHSIYGDATDSFNMFVGCTGAGNTNYTGGGLIPLNEWVAVAVIWDISVANAQVSLWWAPLGRRLIRQANSSLQEGAGTGNDDSAKTHYLGAQPTIALNGGPYSYAFVAILPGVALVEQEIQQWGANPLGYRPRGVRGLWMPAEGTPSSTRVNDYSGYGHHGTATGTINVPVPGPALSLLVARERRRSAKAPAAGGGGGTSPYYYRWRRKTA